MTLTDEAFRRFRQSKALGTNTSPEEMGYSPDGLLLGTTQEGVLRLYSPISGGVQNIVHIQNIQKFSFIYPNSIIHSASNMLYFLSTFDNRYVRTFHGHEGHVRMISVCGGEDTLVSSSSECVNYWDVRKKNPVYRIDATDPLGCVSSSNEYAVVLSNTLLKIYDKRNTKGPRTTTRLPERRYREMVYSPDSTALVVSGERTHVLVDAEGVMRSSIDVERDGSGCITPDSGYFLYCSGPLVLVHHLRSWRMAHAFETPSLDSTKVRFNPRYEQFVSASSLLNFWAVGDGE